MGLAVGDNLGISEKSKRLRSSIAPPSALFHKSNPTLNYDKEADTSLPKTKNLPKPTSSLKPTSNRANEVGSISSSSSNSSTSGSSSNRVQEVGIDIASSSALYHKSNPTLNYDKKADTSLPKTKNLPKPTSSLKPISNRAKEVASSISSSSNSSTSGSSSDRVQEVGS
eukprot:Pgem_evm1s18437